jgi:hypothetical protein
MSLDFSELEWAVRLGGQLKTLSELTESLTYRMLQLEERVAGQQRELTARQQSAEDRHISLSEAMEERLRETENRLVRLEGLLRNVERRAPSTPPLRAVPQPSAVPSQRSLREPRGFASAHGETCLDEDIPGAEERFDQSLAS